MPDMPPDAKNCSSEPRNWAMSHWLSAPDVPNDLAEANQQCDLKLELDHLTYFVGGEIVLANPDTGMSGWRSALYALMARNEMPATRYFNLPPAQVFEIGKRVNV
jgi:K+ transporter